jgi:Tfp pilus assembly protein PilV
MNRSLNLEASRARRSGQHGSILVETLIAMVILATGMGGLLALLTVSMSTNNRTAKDTTSTMIAEHILEQISAQPADSGTALQITDCAGNTWNINTADAPQGGGNSNGYGGNGANLTAAGAVDWIQPYASVPTGYKMRYVSCGAGGARTVYTVRWNIITMTTYSRMIVVSARPQGTGFGGLRYVTPVSLRTIGGM